MEDPNNIVRPKKYLRKYILSKQRLYCNFCDNWDHTMHLKILVVLPISEENTHIFYNDLQWLCCLKILVKILKTVSLLYHTYPFCQSQIPWKVKYAHIRNINAGRENYAFFCPLTSKEKLFKPQRSLWKPEVFRIVTSRYSYKLCSKNLDRLRVRRFWVHSRS